MRDKRIKLIYFSLGGSQAKQYSFGWKKILLFSTAIVFGLCSMAAILLGLFTDVLQDYQLNHLKKANAQLRNELFAFDKAVQHLNEQMKLIEEKEKDYCFFLDMSPLGDDIRAVGTGGHLTSSYRDEAISALETDLRQEATAIHKIIDQLTRRVDLSWRTREAIRKKYFEKQENFKHFPSIWPVNGRRITGKFGHRIHPITGKPDYHPGIDISAPRGTDVWATADGVVTRARAHKYTPNKGYGRFVELDHGNGFMTRYAHLSTVDVKVGQKIKRGQVIGKVGDTGSATGPHLHYEVIKSKSPKNPWEYMLDD